MPRRRSSGGEYTESVSDEDILYWFEASERGFYSSNEIAEQFDLNRSQAHRRLSNLAESGELEKVELGARSVVWRRPRYVIVVRDEDEGHSIVDTETGVGSQGETVPEALRMLAEALESHHGVGDMTSQDVYEELGVERDELDEDAVPPWMRRE